MAKPSRTRWLIPAAVLGGYLLAMGLRTGANFLRSYLDYREGKHLGIVLATEIGPLYPLSSSRNVPLKDVISLPEGEGNAAGIYRRLIDELENEPGHNGSLSEAQFEEVLHATSIRRCSFAQLDKDLLTGELSVLHDIAAQILTRGRQLEGEQEYKAAKMLYERVVVFGEHLRQCSLDLKQEAFAQDISGAAVDHLVGLAISSGDPTPLRKLLKRRDEDMQQAALLTKGLEDLYPSGISGADRLYVALKYLKEHPSPIYRAEAIHSIAFHLSRAIAEIESLKSLPLFYTLVLWENLQARKDSFWRSKDIISGLEDVVSSDKQLPYVRLLAEEVINLNGDNYLRHVSAGRVPPAPKRDYYEQ